MSIFFTDEFQPGSAAAWKQKIQFELQGSDYNKTLLTPTNEGITIKPFYHANYFEKVLVPPSSNKYKICQAVYIKTDEEANALALTYIEKGINSIKFIALKPFDSTILFQNLLHKNIEFHFHLSFLSEKFIDALCKTLNSETIYLNIDSIGNLAKTGNWFTNLNDDFNTINRLLKKHENKNVIAVNVYIYQNAGANTVQQVAYALAHANEYFQKFGAEIASKIQFNFAIGSNFFFEISKIRAFKYLYQLICEQYAIATTPIICIEPSFRNKTLYNYTNNCQRTSLEFTSGVYGGAHTILNNLPNKTNLNQLLSLKDELANNNSQDITTDSYYIESITKQIAEKALAIFKEIENGGGFLQQLKDGTIQRKIAENAKKEQDSFNTGESILVGANKYKTQTKEDKLNYFSDVLNTQNIRKTLIIPIIVKRLSEKIEQKKI